MKTIALFSGGLDSILAVKLIQKQNINVTGLTFTTPFFNDSKAREAAGQIQLPLIVQDITEEHLYMLKSPRYGYGKCMNPCIDCHTLMLKIAGEKMKEIGADFLITGEVLGQRPMSQTKQSLYLVAKNSGYADSILRPLSAQLLDPIKAEREGKLDRTQLLSISGRGRKEQMHLAQEFGIHHYPPPAGGCLLTDPEFSRRLRELMNNTNECQIRDYHLLKFGRHFRDASGSKIIVGRNKADNDALRNLTGDEDWTCIVAGYPGPYVLVPYGTSYALPFAAALSVRYSDAPNNIQVEVTCRNRRETTRLLCSSATPEECARHMI